MKTFALIAHTAHNMVWYATGGFEDMQEAMRNAIATSSEESHFMIVRVYDSGNGAIGLDSNLV